MNRVRQENVHALLKQKKNKNRHKHNLESHDKFVSL